MSFEPGLHLGMLVCAVVVHHEVQGGLAGKPWSKLSQKL